MKLFFCEFPANYSSYCFPYQVLLLKEEKDNEEKIYDNGFLPIRSLPGVYYLARSLRVDLDYFEPSSENRRILRKTESIETKFLPISEFSYNARVQKLCKDYSKGRLNNLFSTFEIKKLFSGQVYNCVFVYREKKSLKEVGYSICYQTKNILQYAHAFYDLNLLPQNLGARMILEAVIWAKSNQKKYIYLGTCYEKNSLYKTEFKGIEFFNGFRWSNNLEELKYLISLEDSLPESPYLLKREDYLQKFYQNDLKQILNNFGIRVNL